MFALNVKKRICLPPKNVAMEMVGTMANSIVRPQDIALVDDMYGKSIEAYRGRTTKRRSTAAQHNPIYESVMVNQNAIE